jgi:hypothetical protein
MATKTIVCPECQAPVVPGRYACAQCGALLASVALTPRSFGGGGRENGPDVVPAEATAEVAGPHGVAPGPHGVAPMPSHEGGSASEPLVVTRTRRMEAAPAWTESLAAEPLESTAGVEERWDDEPPTDTVARRTAAAAAPVDPIVRDAGDGTAGGAVEGLAPTTVGKILERVAPTRAPARKAAPIAEAQAATAPKPRRRAAPDPAALERIAPMAEPLLAGDAEPRFVAEAAPLAAAAPVTARAAVEARPEPAILSRVVDVPAPRPKPAAMVVPAPRPEPAAMAVPAARIESVPSLDPAAMAVPAPPVEPAPSVEPAPRLDSPPRHERAPAAAPAPAWPPPGDRGPLAEPAARVPAGVYLPPSAVLPPGESPPVAGSTNGRPAEPRTAAAATSPGGTSGGGTTERVSAADRLAQLDLPADTPRRLVAIGAVVAALGFLLPWTASPVNNDVLGDYWVRWGMAGPGAWIVVVLLLGLAGLTLAGGRLAEVSVGLPGVAAAMLVLGLTWPYLFGFGGRPVGIWVVLAGVILLAIGGLLDLRGPRHDESPPAV